MQRPLYLLVLNYSIVKASNLEIGIRGLNVACIPKLEAEKRIKVKVKKRTLLEMFLLLQNLCIHLYTALMCGCQKAGLKQIF